LIVSFDSIKGAISFPITKIPDFGWPVSAFKKNIKAESKGIICLHPTTGCPLAEMIPVEPDPDNAGEGNGLRFAFYATGVP